MATAHISRDDLEAKFRSVQEQLQGIADDKEQARLKALKDLLEDLKPLIEQGTLKALAVSSAARIPGSEQVPTISETLPGLEFIGWFILSAPAGLPPPIVDRLNREMAVIMGSPEQQRRPREHRHQQHVEALP